MYYSVEGLKICTIIVVLSLLKLYFFSRAISRPVVITSHQSSFTGNTYKLRRLEGPTQLVWNSLHQVKTFNERGQEKLPFSALKSPYRSNGASLDQSYYWSVIESCIWTFDWYQNKWYWIILISHYTHSIALYVSCGTLHTNLNED